jgi:hypothetical protein
MKTPPNIQAVRQAMVRSRRSARKHPTDWHSCHSSVWRLLHKDSNFHLYKKVLVQQTSDLGKENHAIFSENFLNVPTDDEVILISGEAHFHLSGTVKKTKFPLLG